MSNGNTQNKRQDDPWWGTKHSQQSIEYKDYDDYASSADSAFYAYIDKLNIPRNSEPANALKAAMLAGRMPFIDPSLTPGTSPSHITGSYWGPSGKIIHTYPDKPGEESILGSQFSSGGIGLPFLADPSLLSNKEILKDRPDTLRVPEPWNDKVYSEEKPFDSVLAELGHAIDISNTPQYLRLMQTIKGAFEGLFFGSDTYGIEGTVENIAHSGTQTILERALATSFSEHMPDYRTPEGDLPVSTSHYNTEGSQLTDWQIENLHPETREELLTPGELSKASDVPIDEYIKSNWLNIK